MQIKRHGLRATMLATAVFTVVGAGSAAFADDTSENYGIGNGNQVTAPISVAGDLCGNSVAVVGKALAACEGGASAVSTANSNNTTSGNYGAGNGNQVTAPIAVAGDACGNAVAVIAKALAGCVGGADAVATTEGAAGDTSANYGLGNGNQGSAPVADANNLCGNAGGALGVAVAECEGGAAAAADAPSAGTTSDNYGGGNGNQAVAPADSANNACGNAVGNGLASCAGGAMAAAGGMPGTEALPNLPISAPAAPGMSSLPKLPVAMPALPLGGASTGGLPLVGGLLAGLPIPGM